MKLNKEQLTFLIAESQTYFGKLVTEKRGANVPQKTVIKIDKEIRWTSNLLNTLREMKGGK